jgi:prepilin peptidase CpaA
MDVIITHMALGGLLVAAAVSDLRTLRIPNAIPAAIALIFAVAIGFGVIHPVGPHLISSAIAATIGVLLFASNIWGGGDTKLIAALALFLVPSQLMRFFLVTALAGGVVAAAIIVHRRWLGRPTSRKTSMPFGLALAAGGLDWCLS